MKRISLTTWIFIGMTAGVIVGVAFPGFATELNLFSVIFLRLIKSIVAPLLFATLVYGIAATGDMKMMGRIGLKAIVYFEVVTTIALFLGLGAVNLTRPGDGVRLEKPAAAADAPTAPPPTVRSILEHTFPTSIIDAMAKGEVLQIVVFSVLFGIAAGAIGKKSKVMVDFCESLSEVMFRYTNYIMLFTPVAVFAALAAAIGHRGLGVLVNLGKLVLTCYAALIVFVVLVLGAVMLIARIPIKRFFYTVREPVILAFSTASSEAALPRALENMEKFGVPRHIVSFVLPAGYSFNLDGTTLYLSLASVFVAQAAGVELTLAQQVVMMLTLMLTSKGVAGVPRASLVILAGTLAMFHLPAEGIFVILAVDELMDMARTSVNVLGNCLASAVVARWEGYDLSPKEPEPEAVGT